MKDYDFAIAVTMCVVGLLTVSIGIPVWWQHYVGMAQSVQLSWCVWDLLLVLGALYVLRKVW